ncbi:hypothetical protein LEN26_016643 [Aphanomyces euteiches]|nr:hypothetical protein LEN26_016643 [Aphanomyces euteiches]KAH9102011.1 hypothetical protein AeMF1_021344 [Aphanomyces euteiches]KAH9118184.1 hypothetical protein AeMF1_008516 [Aphanomyces euteiches]KAH9122220.1 hypothetical protein AeMF1_006393 [Aphanomyces euteiches]KAH9183261.1 hypothetical protein AeNC1_014763 [Aphanomyces euteiches]
MKVSTALVAAGCAGLCVFLTYLDAQLGYVALFSAVFFAIRSLVVPYLSSTYVAAYREQKLEFATLENRLLWSNTAVSLIHSCLSSALSVFVLFFTPIDDWIHSCSTAALICLSLSTGYFIYDFYDMVAGDLWQRAAGILVHHIMVVTCYVAALHYHVAVPFLVVMLLLEINSICLHARKLMSMVGFTMLDRVYGLAWQALWMTFYTTRVLVPLGVHVGVFLDRDRFPHLMQFITAFLGTSVLHVLNFMVYQGCSKAYSKELKAKRTA